MTVQSSPRRILLTGASGLVGSALQPVLESRGHTVVKLVRGTGTPTTGSANWNPKSGEIDLSQVGQLDAVVHLAGENIAQRWSPAVKQRIRDSRVKGTRQLADAISKLDSLPKVLICASATGFYGDRGDEWLDESSSPGTGFLADTCQEWEAAANPARASGIRVVHLRFGIVLSPRGGALAKMLPSFRLGIAGPLGNGRSYWSWITLDDLVEVIHHALDTETLAGPVATVSPSPVTNAEFTKTLGRVLHRPTFLPVPAFALQMLFGDMAREAMLASARVKPARLLETGFRFQHGALEPALEHLLGRK
ncbi:MAG: TIGR01777 family protein [Verrucomicrobia bacterium]|nr:TIGR01777 family protein [Verrucomicrobiota bacterium]